MQAALPYIVVLQLLLTLGLAVLLFGLARQVGILHERVAPMGAMASDQGLAVGEMSPKLSRDHARRRAARPRRCESARAEPAVAVRVPTCPVCKKLLPIARSFAHAERLDVLLVGDGDDAEQRSMIREFGLEGSCPTSTHRRWA